MEITLHLDLRCSILVGKWITNGLCLQSMTTWKDYVETEISSKQWSSMGRITVGKIKNVIFCTYFVYHPISIHG